MSHWAVRSCESGGDGVEVGAQPGGGITRRIIIRCNDTRGRAHPASGVTGWLTRRPDTLDEDERLEVTTILARSDLLTTTARRVREFAVIAHRTPRPPAE
jgi:hypothetical protein